MSLAQRFGLIGVLLCLSCGTKEPKDQSIKYYPLEESAIQSLIHEQKLPLNAPWSTDKLLFVEALPAQIILFQDHEFYYLIQNTIQGTGYWSLVDGVIHLKSESSDYDLLMFIKATNPEGSALELIYEDQNQVQKKPILIKSSFISS